MENIKLQKQNSAYKIIAQATTKHTMHTYEVDSSLELEVLQYIGIGDIGLFLSNGISISLNIG